jgi:hypothetical protein
MSHLSPVDYKQAAPGTGRGRRGGAADFSIRNVLLNNNKGVTLHFKAEKIKLQT